MELEEGKQQLIMYIKKYRYVMIVLLLGIAIMLIPERKQEQQSAAIVQESAPLTLEERLGQILSQIDGVGKAEVLLTEKSGMERIFQTDTGQNAAHHDTVVLSDSNREESGLVKQIIPPVYRGAIVVCRGADRASVRLAVVEAVKRVTGLSSDNITVLKMK